MSLSQLPRLVRALTNEPLCVEPTFLRAFADLVRRHSLQGVSFTGEEIHAELGVAMPRAQREAGTKSRTVAVIPIVGAIANRAQSMGVGADQIGAAIESVVNNPRIDAVVLDMETPGGTVPGVPELAEKVFQARAVKPIVAVANGMMASAGYWIGAAASEVVVTESGEGAGSIGVYMIHEDWTAAFEAEGVRVTEISAGKYKTEGAPWKALDEEGMAHLDGRVQDVYKWFTKDVARFRGATPAAVRGGFGEGRVLAGREAVNAGLADRVDTLDGTIARLAAGKFPRSGARAEADFVAMEARKRARMR